MPRATTTFTPISGKYGIDRRSSPTVGVGRPVRHSRASGDDHALVERFPNAWTVPDAAAAASAPASRPMVKRSTVASGRIESTAAAIPNTTRPTMSNAAQWLR